jgi:hypothetical protein
MKKQRASKKWKTEDKIAVAILGLIVSGFGFVAAIEKFYWHPTFGNGLQAFMAAYNLAEG